MDKNSAVQLIKEVFQNPFDKERFIFFVRNLLNHFTEAPFIYRGNFIPDAYDSYIKTLERIGKYEDPEGNKIDILIVNLKKEKSLEHARTMQRNFIAWYLNGSRGGIQKDAALVVFVSPKKDDWRFSLVKMEYKLTETQKGRIKAKEELTPAKRFSFLVGEHESSHTAQSRLVPILEDDVNNPTLKQLEEAFNIEKVTKEFFEKYRDILIWTKEELDEIFRTNKKVKSEFITKNIDFVVFAKKLLGQIVFLYFLQKKGWLGAKEKFGDGDKKFLRNLFEKAKKEKKNFFNDYLEFLFYDALNNERRGLTDSSYHSYFGCKIPFLNGGLFEPLRNYDWKNTDIFLPNELFSNDYRTKKGDMGTGILDIFDRFNFTVKEDEPLDKEVAIDPELLGKLYEKFNAITSDNFSEYLKIIKSGKKGEEAKFNKQYGVYYTPSEIVQYMCKESLINYLTSEFESVVDKSDFEKLVNYADQILENEKIVPIKKEEIKRGKIKETKYKSKIPNSIKRHVKAIDEKLANIKVCDPAVGSGAFPIGMMNQIVNIRELFSVLLKTDKTRYDLKLGCIENSLYGVDIDPGAIEICKLRFWLSLVVDEERLDIKPLPNLDYKVMQGNSLLEEYEGIKLFDKSLLYTQLPDETEIENLKQHKSKIERQLLEFYQRNPRWMNDKKVEKPEKLLALEKEHERIILVSKDKEKFKAPDSQTSNLFGEEKKSKKIWEKLKELQHKYFSTFDESKLSIREEIENLIWKLIEETLIENRQKSKISEIQKIKESGKRPFFIWELNFPEIFANNDKHDGFDVVIANPPYIDSEGMVKRGQRNIREIIQKTYVFTKGNWDIYIAFLELAFKKINGLGVVAFITPDKWISKPFGDEFRKNTIKNIYLIVRAGREIFESSKVDSIISFFSKKQSQKINILEFKDKTFIKKREVDKKVIIEPFTLDWLFSDHLNLLMKIDLITAEASSLGNCENACATSDAYKLEPLIKNSDEFNKRNQLKIINTGTIGKYYSKWGKREMTYLGHKYLKPVINKDKFFNLFKNSYAKKSAKPKIILKGLNLLDACLDIEGDTIPGKSTLVITSEKINELKLLLAIINSKLIYFYLKEKFVASSYNQGISFTKGMINNLPLPKIEQRNRNLIIKIVDKILAITKDNDYLENSAKQAKVHEYEKQIDRLVYKLYGLTAEEIKIVENHG
jgi:hypothetical protein